MICHVKAADCITVSHNIGRIEIEVIKWRAARARVRGMTLCFMHRLCFISVKFLHT